jgi:hypothetical protein
MKRILLTLPVLLFFAVPPAPAQTASSAAKIAQLIETSSYHINRKTDTVWYIDLHGKSLKDFKLIFAVQDDLLVAFVTAATKAQMPETPEFMHVLLRFNHTIDRVKIGLDDDGDLSVRCDASVRVLDAAEFRAVLDQVAAAADEVHKGVSAFLSPK